MKDSTFEGIWIFGDHRNYFQDRVTLQLLSRAREMAETLNCYVGVVLFGHDVDEYVMEYTAHGADRIFLVDHPRLKHYSSDIYTTLLTELVREYRPEILLVSGSDFGRELAPRLAARLETGLSADCVSLQIDEEGNLIQISPAYDGSALAEIITPQRLPQIATVRPGVFRERKHDYRGQAELIRIEADVDAMEERVRVVSSRRMEHREEGLEKAEYILCLGKGFSRKENLRKARELAVLMEAEIGCTRPVCESGLLPHEKLIGQTGKTVKPRLLLIAGASGALQFTAAIGGSDCIVAVNKDPGAPVFRSCDIGVVGDAASLLNRLTRHLKS